MNRFGKILQWAFPKFIDRMIELSTIKDDCNRRKRIYGLFWMTNNGQSEIELRKQYNERAKEFNDKKYWWIGKIKYIEKRTYITQEKTGDST